MSTKSIELKGFIREVRADRIFIGLSQDYSNIINANNLVVRPNIIQFRNQPAPKNLIAVNTSVLLKIENGKIVDIRLENDLDIHAFFGFLNSVDSTARTVSVSYGLDAYELTFKQITYIDSKPIVETEIPSKVNSPVIIYFNREAPVEVRILSLGWKQTFKLDYFKRNTLNQEEVEFFVLKDQRLILHRIPSTWVYYSGYDMNFSADQVKSCIGVEVEVWVNDQNAVIASVRTRSNSSYQTHSKPTNSSLELKNNSNIKYESARHSIKEKNAPVFGSRGRVTGSTLSLFYKENKYFRETGVVVLALLETAYRFPHLKLRTTLYQQYVEAMRMYQGQGYKEVVDSIFCMSRRSDLEGEIEKFYQLISTSSGILEYYACHFIQTPLDFALIANTYSICIYFYDPNNILTTYLPFNQYDQIPFIYFRMSTELQIVYSPQMMKYDGYTDVSLCYTHPVDVDQRELFCFPIKEPEFPRLFERILKLQDLVFNKESSNENIILNLFKEISYSLGNCSTYIPSEQRSSCEDYYQKLLMFKVKDQVVNLCGCGKAGCQEFLCGDHLLCKTCAFVSSRLGFCVTCTTVFEKKVIYEDAVCTYCEQRYEEKYFTGFTCKCIFCVSCIYKSLQNRMCVKGHSLQEFDYDKSLQFLRYLGYNI